jgi:hypothetical protein
MAGSFAAAAADEVRESVVYLGRKKKFTGSLVAETCGKSGGELTRHSPSSG